MAGRPWAEEEPSLPWSDEKEAGARAPERLVTPTLAPPRRRRSAGPVIFAVIAMLVLLGAGIVGAAAVARSGGLDGTVLGPILPASGGSEASVAGLGSSELRAALTIDVTPDDARVVIDGEEIEHASPLVAPVEPGRHRVEVTRDGYIAFEAEVAVMEGGLRLPVVLQSEQVELSVEVVPAQAQIKILADGEVIHTGVNGSRIPLARDPGVDYEIEVAAPEHTTLRQPLTFTGETTQALLLTLPKARSTGASGGAAGVELPLQVDSAPPARASSKPKSRSKSKPRSQAKAKSRPPAAPNPPKAKTATLRIGTVPGVSPAEVFVDGLHVGTTIIAAYAVAPGRHRVELVWGSGRRSTKMVTVRDGETKRIRGGG